MSYVFTRFYKKISPPLYSNKLSNFNRIMIKHLPIVLICCVPILTYSQANSKVEINTNGARLVGNTFINHFEKEKPTGSPYNNKSFAPANVENVAQKAMMRYNVYRDELEFITAKNDTLILDKIDDFSNIVFSGTNKKYMLVNYTGSNGKSERGYLISIHGNGDFLLFKKENIRLYEGKVAKTSLERDMPAKYVKADDTYFLKMKDGAIVEFPESKKQLIKLFPDKKQSIEIFLKEKNISFNEAADRIKIIDFLAEM